MMLAGPSQPASDTVRIAPQKTTGLSVSRVRSRRNAVSSSVSVPWVITTASTAGSAHTSATRWRSRHIQSRRHVGAGQPGVVLESEPRLAAQAVHAGDDLLAGEGGHRRPGAGIDAHGDRAAGEQHVDVLAGAGHAASPRDDDGEGGHDQDAAGEGSAPGRSPKTA